MNEPPVDILICTYNSKKIIDSCLQSISKLKYKNYSCIVIDDNSSDGTCEYIKRKYKWVKIVKKKERTGPSISRNIGLKVSSGKYIAFLDSDVTVPSNWLEENVKLMDKNNEVGICGSKLVFSWNKKKINAAGGGMKKLGIGFDIGFGEDVSKYMTQREVIYACSAAMLVRRDMIKKIGGFDETYFYGHEDTDLGWRANIAGYKVVYNPRAIAYHAVNATVGNMGSKIRYHATKNRLRSLIKNYEFTNLLKQLPLLLLVSFGDFLVRSGQRKAIMSALVWVILNLGSTIRERTKVQKARKVTDRELTHLLTDNNMTHLYSWSRISL